MKKDPKAEVAAAANVPPSGENKKAPEVRYNTKQSRFVKKRNQRNAGCWAQGGTLECHKATDWALAELAGLRHVEINPNTRQVEKVRAARITDEERILIHPTYSTDLDGVELKRYKGGKIVINLYDFLAAENLLIPVGKRERFELEMVTGSESPVGPALRLDLSRPLATRIVETTKKPSSSKKKIAEPDQKEKKE